MKPMLLFLITTTAAYAQPVPQPIEDPVEQAVEQAVEDPVEFDCPIGIIKEVYLNINQAEGILAALTVEQHVLNICIQSQKKIIEVALNNEKIKTIFTSSQQPLPTPVAAVPIVVPITPVEPDLPKANLIAITPSATEEDTFLAIIEIDENIIEVLNGSIIETGEDPEFNGVVLEISETQVTILYDNDQQQIIK